MKFADRLGAMAPGFPSPAESLDEVATFMCHFAVLLRWEAKTLLKTGFILWGVFPAKRPEGQSDLNADVERLRALVVFSSCRSRCPGGRFPSKQAIARLPTVRPSQVGSFPTHSDIV